MGTNTLLDEIPTYFVLDFLQTKASLTIKAERRRESEICNVSAILEISAQFINKLEAVPMVVLSSFKFSFSH